MSSELPAFPFPHLQTGDTWPISLGCYEDSVNEDLDSIRSVLGVLEASQKVYQIDEKIYIIDINR